MNEEQDKIWMERAIEQGWAARANGLAPFGAVVVGPEGQLIAEGYNLVRRDFDPSAHGEVVAIRKACANLQLTELLGCTLYTTCEPCLLCTTLILRTGLARVVYGASDSDLSNERPRPGLFPMLGLHLLDAANWVNGLVGREILTVTPGFMREACLPLYSDFAF